LKQELENNKSDSDESDDGKNKQNGKLIDSHDTWQESQGDKDLQKEADVKSKIAELELKIENFKKFGIAEKLEKETVVNFILTEKKRKIQF